MFDSRSTWTVTEAGRTRTGSAAAGQVAGQVRAAALMAFFSSVMYAYECESCCRTFGPYLVLFG